EIQLRRPPIEVERLRAKVEIAERQVERLTRLVNELLDATRFEAGHLTLDREEVDLGALVRDVASRYHVESERGGSSIELDLAEGVIGRWDRQKLDHVVYNLLQNAIKYGRGRPIQITVEALEERARLSVKDQGIGISTDDLERIFGRFERAV